MFKQVLIIQEPFTPLCLSEMTITTKPTNTAWLKAMATEGMLEEVGKVERSGRKVPLYKRTGALAVASRSHTESKQ